MKKSKKKKNNLSDKSDKKWQKLIKNYIKCFGNITDTCKKSRISRDTFYRWLKEKPERESQLEEADKIIEDNVEKEFIEKDLKKHYPARKFWLERRHKKYKPKLEAEIKEKPAFYWPEDEEN